MKETKTEKKISSNKTSFKRNWIDDVTRDGENDEEKTNSCINIITSTFFVLFNVTWSDYVGSSFEHTHT